MADRRTPLWSEQPGDHGDRLERLLPPPGTRGVNQELAEEFKPDRLPTKADRRRAFLGHTLTTMPANPLTPAKTVRLRHPKLLPEGTRQRLVEARPAARDRPAVTWLADGGFRVGELCGLHLVDLHLREGAACGECRTPHVHICHRENNPNRARVKTKRPWTIQDGIVRGGTVRRVSPAMVHTYFEYMTTEYPRGVEHGMLLVQLHGPHRGQPWATAGVRKMLRLAGIRLELGRIRPHAFRHEFATDVLDASGGNSLIARDAGGWASATTVEQVYGHVDIHDPAFVTTSLARVTEPLANSSSNALRRWLPMPSGTATKSRSCRPRRLQNPGRATRAAVSARRNARGMTPRPRRSVDRLNPHR
jgi:integrase